MKKLSALFILCVSILSSCDYVDVPQQAHGAGSANDTVRKVFVEDVTGHTCIYCPDGARVIDSLENVFPGQIIPMAIHFGFFAEPCPVPHSLPSGAPAGSFGEDFRVPLEDADYDGIFNFSSWPNPTGMVNRYGFPATVPTAANAWPDTAALILQDSISAYIKIHPAYNQSSRDLNLTVSGILFDTLVGNYNIAIYLVEDGLHGYQLDHTIVPSGIDTNYTFNHVFRGCVNSPGTIGGDPVLAGTTNRGTLISYNMGGTYNVSAAFNAANCKLIAILFDASNYHVVQADEVDLQ